MSPFVQLCIDSQLLVQSQRLTVQNLELHLLLTPGCVLFYFVLIFFIWFFFLYFCIRFFCSIVFNYFILLFYFICYLSFNSIFFLLLIFCFKIPLHQDDFILYRSLCSLDMFALYYIYCSRYRGFLYRIFLWHDWYNSLVLMRSRSRSAQFRTELDTNTGDTCSVSKNQVVKWQINRGEVEPVDLHWVETSHLHSTDYAVQITMD